MKRAKQAAVILIGGMLAAGCVQTIENAGRAGAEVGRGAGNAAGEVVSGVFTAPIAAVVFTVSAAGNFIGGIFEGAGATANFRGADNRAVDAAMRGAGRQGAETYLATVYREAYGQNQVLSQVPGNSVFGCTEQASEGFRRVLRARGVADADDYVITQVRARDPRYTLYALVRRRGGGLGDGCSNTAPPQRSSDVVVDWMATETADMVDPSLQAIFMVAAAHSAAIGRASGNTYWPAEARWRRGDHVSVINEQRRRFNDIMRDAPRGR